MAGRQAALTRPPSRAKQILILLAQQVLLHLAHGVARKVVYEQQLDGSVTSLDEAMAAARALLDAATPGTQTIN